MPLLVQRLILTKADVKWREAVFSGRFRRKCTTLTVASFFRYFSAIGPLFCSFVQQLDELRRFNTLNLRTSPIQKEIKLTSTTSKTHFGYLGVFHLAFFQHNATFLKFFGFHQRNGLPFVCFVILQHNGCQKIPKDHHFTIFGTVTLFKNLFFKFFPDMF